MASGRFVFTVTDLARFLGKSPVTLRGWERQGIVSMARDSGGDRKMTMSEVRDIARVAHGLGRISRERVRLIEAVATMIEIIERENQ